MARRVNAPVGLTLDDDFSARLARPRRAVESFSRSFRGVGAIGTTAFRGVAASTNVATTGFRRALPVLSSFARGLSLANTATLGLSASTRTLGLGLGALGAGAAVQQFRRYELALKRAEISNRSFADSRASVEATIAAVGRRTQNSQADLAAEVETLAKAGFDAAEAQEILAVSAEFAAVRGDELGDVVRVVRSALRAYGLEAKNARDVTDSLLRATSAGDIEVGGLVNTFGRLAGSAREAGVPLAQVLAAIGDITSTGQTAEQSATALNRLFSLVTKGLPPEVASRYPDVAKLINIRQLQDDLRSDPVSGLVTFFRRIDAAIPSPDLFTQLFPEERARRAALALFRDDLNGLERALSQVENRSGATADAFREISETTDFRIRGALAAFKDLLLEIGRALAPAAGGGADSLEDVIRRLADAIADNRVEIGLYIIEIRGLVRRFFEAAQEISRRDGFPAALGFAGELGITLLLTAIKSGLPIIGELLRQGGEIALRAFVGGVASALAEAPIKGAEVLAGLLGFDDAEKLIKVLRDSVGDVVSGAAGGVVDKVTRTDAQRDAAFRKRIKDYTEDLAEESAAAAESAGRRFNISEKLLGLDDTRPIQEKIAFLYNQLSQEARAVLQTIIDTQEATTGQVPPLEEVLKLTKRIFDEEKRVTQQLREQINQRVSNPGPAERAEGPELKALSAEATEREKIIARIEEQRIALDALGAKRDELRAQLAEIRQLEAAGVITRTQAIEEERAALESFRGELESARGAVESLLTASSAAAGTANDVAKLREEFEKLFGALGPQGERFEFLRALEVLDADVDSILRRANRGGRQEPLLERLVGLGQLDVNEFRARVNESRAGFVSLIDEAIAKAEALAATATGKTSPALQDLLAELYEARAELAIPVGPAGEGTDFIGSLTNNLQLAAEEAANFGALSERLAGSLTGAFDGVLDSILGLNEGFQQFAANFLIGIGRMILRAIFFRSVLSLIGLNSGGEVGSDGVALTGLNAGGLAGRDGRRIAFSKPLRLNRGSLGMVPGPMNVNRDIVPALLTPGEFVVNRTGVRGAGLDLLRYFNSGGTTDQLGIDLAAVRGSISRLSPRGHYQSGGEVDTGVARGGGSPIAVTASDPQTADRVIAQGDAALERWARANSSMLRQVLGIGTRRGG